MASKKNLGLSYPSTASGADKKKVDAFYELTSILFPAGVENIPTREEVLAKVKSGSFSLRDAWIMKMANEGGFVGGNILNTAETKEMGNALKDVFPFTQTPQQVDTFRDYVKNLIKAGVNLDQDYNEFTQTTLGTLKKTTVKNISPLNNLIASVQKPDYTLPTVGIKGDRRLAKGAIPKNLLTEVLGAINSIPDQNMRNAVVASLLGYRGADVAGTRTSAFLVGEGQKNRPVYDLESKESGVVKDIEFGLQDRKQIGGSKPLGPVMKLIYDTGLDAAGETGEIFPDIETDDISNALKKHVFPKIDPAVIALLDKPPTGYTDLRRITASAIVNDLANEAYEAGDTARADMFRKLGDQLIGHEIPDSNVYGKVLSTFYTGVEDVADMDQRKDVLYQFERLLATRLKQKDGAELSPRNLAKSLGLKVPKNFNPPKYTEVAPLQKTPEGKIVGPQPDAPVSEELLKAEDEGAVASTKRQAATDSEIATQKRISEAEQLIEGEEKLKEAERIKAELKKVGSDIKKETKLKEKEDAQKLKNKNAADILGEMANKYGPVDQSKPTGKLRNKLMTAAGFIATGAKDVLGAVTDVAASVAVPVAKVAGSLGPMGGPALEGAGIAATAYDISRLQKMPPEQFVPEQVRSFLTEPEFAKEGERAKTKRIALESVGLVPGAADPSLGQAGRMAFPTREEQAAKDLLLKQKEEQRLGIQSSLGESFRVGSNSFLNTN